ncbi:MAG TPA: hypothetical protein PLN69_08170 [bacterium]|nr:hypothetical protein [bacterium]
MSENKKAEFKERWVCEKCGLVHEQPAAPEKTRAEEIKVIVLSAVGVALIALIWVLVFLYGVPFVKQIGG